MKTLDELVLALNRTLDAGSPPDSGAREESVPQARVLRLSDLTGPGTAGEFVRRAFRAVLKRDPDEAALAHYAEAIEQGGCDRAQLLRDLLAGEEGRLVGCAVIGLSSAEEVTAALAADSIRLAGAVERLEQTLSAIALRLERIPRAQEYLLRTIEEYMQDYAARLDRAAEPREPAPRLW